MIAPIILGFAAVGAAFLHVVYRYNLIYVYDSEIDTKGLVYPRALLQMLVGLYFAEVCMIGLFSLRGAFGPVVLTVALLVVTVLVHVSLLDALGPLLWSLPKSLTVEEDEHLLAKHPEQQHMKAHDDPEGLRYLPAFDFEPNAEKHDSLGNRGLEGADGAMNALGGGLKSWLKQKVSKDFPELHTTSTKLASFGMRWISPDPNQKSNFLLRWLHPEVYSDYTILRRMVPADLPDPVYPKEVEDDIYYPPSFQAKPPCLWIPRDPGGISQQEMKHSSRVIPITDEYVAIDEKGSLSINLEDSRLVFDIDRLRY